MILRAPDALQGLPTPFVRAVSSGGGTVFLQRNVLGADAWRVLVTEEDSQGTPVTVALPIEDVEDTQALLEGILWTTATIVISLTLTFGILAGVLAQRRLARIDATLGEHAAGDLTACTGSTQSKDDIDDIARQLDAAAGELERLVTQTRNLSASIAHDLRTPLTRLRAQLEMLPGRDFFEAVVEDEGKELALELTAPATVSADRQMLVQVIANLIQSAIAHGGDTITLEAAGASLAVSDNGPGVDPESYGEILKPMVRLDAGRTKSGSGLGLALVRAVADRHGAKLALSQVAPQGLKVSLNLTNM